MECCVDGELMTSDEVKRLRINDKMKCWNEAKIWGGFYRSGVAGRFKVTDAAQDRSTPKSILRHLVGLFGRGNNVYLSKEKRLKFPTRKLLFKPFLCGCYVWFF